jgi:hypothetical protein
MITVLLLPSAMRTVGDAVALMLAIPTHCPAEGANAVIAHASGNAAYPAGRRSVRPTRKIAGPVTGQCLLFIEVISRRRTVTGPQTLEAAWRGWRSGRRRCAATARAAAAT